jgi:tetratricopeptide (TPR) repeat protein
MTSRRNRKTILIVAALAFFASGVTWSAQKDAPGSDRAGSKGVKKSHENPPQRNPVLELLRLRNEGVVHFESGIGLKKSRERFEAALRVKPNSAIEVYNLATANRKLGDTDKALKQLIRASQLDSSLPHPFYSMALLYRSSGKNDLAVEMLNKAKSLAPNESSIYYQLGRMQRETGKNKEALQANLHALQLDPFHTGALYQLFLYYQEQGEKDLAQRTFDEFSRIKRALSASRKEINEDESVLARPIGGMGNQPFAGSRTAFEADFTYEDLGVDGMSVAIDLFDVNGDGLDDLIAASNDGNLRVTENRNGFTHPADIQIVSKGVGSVRAVVAESFVRGEAPRLAVMTDAGIYITSGPVKDKGITLTKLSARSGHEWAMVDVDHDGDIDIVVGAFDTVLLNQGNAVFMEETSYLGANATDALRALRGQITAADLLNQSGVDYLLSDPAGQRRLLKDALGGKYETLPVEQLAARPGLRWQGVADLDNDGSADLLSLTDRELAADFNIGTYQFQGAVLMTFDATTAESPAQAAIGDFNNDGREDIVITRGGHEAMILINQGSRKFEKKTIATKGMAASVDLRIVDVDGDGRQDILSVAEGGKIRLWRNHSKGVGKSMWLTLTGKRSAPSGKQARVEVRRGDFYAKYESDGRPMHVALGEAGYAEIVRIIWANGFVESKLNIEAGKHWTFEESERVSGSCPSLFTWDGQRFRFITDAFISGPMGVPMSPGRYFPVDHDEYIRIPGDLLHADAGVLRVAITEELREAVYLDQARLYAVDRPEAVEVYPNEYLAPGDFPKFKLHATEHALPPPAVFDHKGRDVRDLITTNDHRYPSDFKKLPYVGLVEPQGVEIVLPPGAAASEDLRLFLTGWFYYFESTSLIAASQRPDLPIIWPQVQVLRDGQWEKVTDIGIPPGKDKTVVIDLGGKLPADAERIRIWTNFELYWDRIIVDTTPPPALDPRNFRQVPMKLGRLRFRGFSEIIRGSGEFPQPERFDYSNVHYTAMWNPLRGKYTRYGDVQPLLASVDNRFMVFGSGDEAQLEFDASGLPPLAPNWRRDYMLYLNGYVKDGDRYTAYAGAIDPMPFVGMQSYPYSEDDRRKAPFDSPEYRAYLAEYQTRDPLSFTGPRLGQEPITPAAMHE